MSKIYIVFLLLLLGTISSLETRKKKIGTVPKYVLKMIQKKAHHILEAAGGNSQCAQDLKTVFNDVIHFKRWAVEMIDASSKLQSGILAGNLRSFGNFDECLGIKEVKKNVTIQGQYCTVSLQPSEGYMTSIDSFNAATLKDFFNVKTTTQQRDLLEEIKISYGLCIPDSCSIQNLQKLWDYMEFTFSIPVHMKFVDMMCSSNTKNIQPLAIDVYVYALFGIYFIFLAICTACDCFIWENKDVNKNFLLSFSLYTNGKKLLHLDEEESDLRYLSAISGIKVICMLWILYGHRLVLELLTGVVNLMHLDKWRYTFSAQLVLSATLSVDTFLFLSGLLVSYGILKYHSGKTGEVKIPVLYLYIYRFLRLTPAAVALIMFNLSVFKNITSGPYWPYQATKYVLTCSKTWFFNLLYLNNIINYKGQCGEHSWYLAIDSQLFFISPIILTNLIKYPLKTIFACLAVCVVSGIYTFVITINNNYGAIYLESNVEYISNIYESTIVRMPPWFIGIIFGYIIFNYNNVKLSKVNNFLGWTVTFSTFLGIIMVHKVFAVATEYNALHAALYNSCIRTVWSLAVGLMLFLCVNEKEGAMNKFLSKPLFRIIVRLAYSFYLTQGIVLFYFTSGKKTPTYFSDISNIHNFFGDIFFILPVAVFWSLAFESPFISIAKYLFKRETQKLVLRKKKAKKTKNNYLVCVYKYEGVGEVSHKKIK